MGVGRTLLFCSVLLGCKEPNPNYCKEGPVEQCGCDPGEAITCDGDQLTRCNLAGNAYETITCALGCSVEDVCVTFEPSNGLGAALQMAASQPDIVLPAGSRIDTETGLVQDANGTSIPIPSTLIEQIGGAGIRAFAAKSWIIQGAVVRGTRALALVADTTITIQGPFDASADATVNGPGAQEEPAVCVGQSVDIPPCDIGCSANGAGGGGNATNGGIGGGFSQAGAAGGALVPQFEPLVGGCRGGTFRVDGTAKRLGGAGGGAVQLVAGAKVVVSGAGLINLGGGGGESSGGGGSGGTLIVEAPEFAIDGASAGVVANGGAGGGCFQTGADAQLTTFPAVAPRCQYSSAGNGATEQMAPGAGQLKCPASSCSANELQGGGGGAVGRMLVTTRDGTMAKVGEPILSVVVTARTLQTQ